MCPFCRSQRKTKHQYFLFLFSPLRFLKWHRLWLGDVGLHGCWTFRRMAFLLWGSHHGGWATFQGMIDEDLPEQLSAINKTALRSSPGSTLCSNALPLWVGNRSDKHVLSRRHRRMLSNRRLVWWKPIWSCVTGGEVSKVTGGVSKSDGNFQTIPAEFHFDVWDSEGLLMIHRIWWLNGSSQLSSVTLALALSRGQM